MLCKYTKTVKSPSPSAMRTLTVSEGLAGSCQLHVVCQLLKQDKNDYKHNSYNEG